MAVQNPYLTTDGDINQAKRKRAGESMAIDAVPKQTSFDVTNTPAGSVPGNPARAAQMQAQFNQPVTKGYGPDLAQQPSIAATQPASGGGGGGIGGVVQQVKNAYSAVSPLINPLGTAADVLTAAPADYLRNSVISAAGGDPATAEGGEYANRDRAFGNLQPAINAAGSAVDAVKQGVKGGVLAATGASPAPEPAATPSALPVASPGKPAASPAKPTAEPVPESPYFATGTGQIAARMNGSTPEFTNDPTAVAGARAMPAGGRGSPLLAPGVSNMADDVALEKRGSINNVGNGIGGGLSVGAPGDAALALGRFERANQEREKMVQISRRGGIGEGGGRVTVVRDSSRAPSITETLRDRQDSRLAQTEATRSQTAQGIMAGADQLMTSQLNRQKTQQEIEAGNVALDSAKRLNEIQQALANPAIDGAQRKALEAAQANLTTTQADRNKSAQASNIQRQKTITSLFEKYSELQPVGADGKTPMPFDAWARPALESAGFESSEGNQNGPARTSVSMSEVEATAKARNMSADEVVAALKEKGVSVAR